MTTTSDDADTSVSMTVDVDASIAHVFETFTQRMQTWWEPTHHLIPDVVEMRVDTVVGGHITDVGADGSTCRWSRVLAYKPPTRFAFSWDISLQWQLESDPSRCSEVEVRFEPITDATTRVTLVHRHLDRHGDGWQEMSRAVGGPSGWRLGLDRLARTA